MRRGRVSFQWEEAEVPLSLSPLFALHCLQLKVMRTISGDNSHISQLCRWQFYHSTQVQMRTISSGDLRFQQVQHAKMTLLFHLLLLSSVISMGQDGERFICFGELPLEVNVPPDAMIRKCMQIWCGCLRGNENLTLNTPLRRWGRLLFDLYTNSLSSPKNITLFLCCVGLNQWWALRNLNANYAI